ncbi:unannotated protein [freshwater metagenome]|uniref:Unannotated protein n=1 Tax=freshwater metagenome TaxID=449393 RepID=A0A6J6BI26_9ZZZZ
MVVQHVLYSCHGVITTRPHLVIGHRSHRHLIAAEAHGRHMTLVDVHQVLEHPAVGRSAIGGELLFIGAATDVLHVADIATLDFWAGLAELLRQPGSPQVWWFNDMIVDTDNHGELIF